MEALGRVCVFCGSSTGTDPVYRDAAVALADTLVDAGIDLVYGGGRLGLMGVVADRVLARGGHVTGVLPVALFDAEAEHRGVTELHETDSMHHRKQLMYELSDAFIALPGGLGTLEELAEIATWAQLGLHRKPLGVLDVAGFFGPLLTFLDGAVAAGFLRPEDRALMLDDTTPAGLLGRLSTAVEHLVDTAET